MERPDIAELKKKYGEVFHVEIDGIEIIFRALTFKEFNDLSIEEDYYSSVESEEAIVRTALVYPEFEILERGRAGVLSALAEEIIEESAFFNAEKAKELLEEHRENSESILISMKALIISAMPSYNDEMLDNYTFSQLLEKVALAEQIHAIKFYSNRGSLSSEADPPSLLLMDGTEEEDAARKAAIRDIARKPGTATSNDPIAQKLAEAMRGL